MDEQAKKEFYAHIGEMLTLYTSAVILSVAGESDETRTMAAETAQRTIDHVADDLRFLLFGPETDKEGSLGEDFEMWAKELNS
jgi:hypothetical protein